MEHIYRTVLRCPLYTFRPKIKDERSSRGLSQAQGQGMPFLFFKSTCYLNGGMWSPLQNSDTLFFYNVSDQHQESSQLVGSIATLTSHQRLPFKSTCCCGGMWSHLDSVTLSINYVSDQTTNPNIYWGIHSHHPQVHIPPMVACGANPEW